jgi:hypothetical protein
MILWDTPITGPCRVTDCTCTKFEKADPTVEQTTTDLHQAIQAATTALCDQHPAIGLSDPWAQVARIAVETAAPVLLQAARSDIDGWRTLAQKSERRIGELLEQLQATRDRHAALEVQVAKVQQFLDESPIGPTRSQACLTLFNIQQVIEQVDGPARGYAILHEVQRLHALTAVEDVPTHPFVAEQRSNLCLLFVQGGRTCGKERDDPIHALDRAAQREGDR